MDVNEQHTDRSIVRHLSKISIQYLNKNYKPVTFNTAVKLWWDTANDSLLRGQYDSKQCLLTPKAGGPALSEVINSFSANYQVSRYVPKLLSLTSGSLKVAAFDFDFTLIRPKHESVKFSRGSSDWSWCYPLVPRFLLALSRENYFIVIFSNQAGLKFSGTSQRDRTDVQARITFFKKKIKSFAIGLGLRVKFSIYAACKYDEYRKPRSGMWSEFLKDCGITDEMVDREASFYVGDAAGRVAQGKTSRRKARKEDFACSDRDFAANLKLKFFTPEEFFLDEPPLAFKRSYEPKMLIKPPMASGNPKFERRYPKELVVFCGSPAIGKSTFYWKVIEPLGYEHINQDTLKTRSNCIEAAENFLKDGKSVVVDNTNPDRTVRSLWINLGRKHAVPVRCINFVGSLELCLHNNAYRAFSWTEQREKRSLLPKISILGFHTRYTTPSVDEGFEDVIEIHFEFQGDEEARVAWSRYWM